MADTTFDVKGMTCDNCVHHVTEAVKRVPGVASVTVSLQSDTAKVEGDFDPKQVISEIEEEGYGASIHAS